MTCPLTSSISFRPPFFNLQPPLQHRRPSRQDKTRHCTHSKLQLATKQTHHLGLKLSPRANATGGLNNSFPASPLSDVIQELYSSLNDKEMERLEKLIAPDCAIYDTAYYKPLDTKNTHAYFKRLMEAMGKNVKFVVEEVCQGVEPTVAVMWHLEWKGKIIPFTKGCSFFICSENGAALLIRKVHIFDESPLKPGKLVLEILNFVTTLLDTFPSIAEGFLKNPDAIVPPCMKFFKFFLEPVIVPLFAYYTRFWTYVARAVIMVLNVLYNVFKWIACIKN